MNELIFKEKGDFLNACKNRYVVIYDTGNAESIINVLDKEVNFKYIVCDDFWRWNSFIGKYQVCSPYTLRGSDYVVLITQPYYAFTVEEKLKSLGITDYFCYGFFIENMNQSFKIGYNYRFISGKAYPKQGEDTCYLNPRLTNNCNLECSFCCVQYGKRKDEIDMPLERYTQLLDDCKGLWLNGRLIDTIELDGSRELFMYPHYKQAIVETYKRGFKTQLVTNGVLLSTDNSKLLLNNGLYNIIVSVSGISPAIYEKHQGHKRNAAEQLATVVENVKSLVRLKQELNSQASIGISYLIDSFSITELKQAIIFWKKVGVNYFWGNALAQQDSDGNLIKKRKHSKKNIPYNICFNPSVAPNGDFNPCFFGEGNVENIVLGNVFETRLSDLMYTEKFTQFYNNLSKRDKTKMNPICVKCPSSGCYEE